MATSSVLPDGRLRKGSGRATGWLLFFAAAMVAFLLYRPDTDAPFEIIDFSETLPFLTDGRDFGDRFAGLVGYYLRHGRAAFALSAGLAAKWTLFEWWTPGWQWIRYVVGLAVVVLAWRLLRALGANRMGASLGASLFIVSETVAPGWLRPSVNEPLGTALLLSASLLACRYQGSRTPVRLAAGIAALLAMMIVVKETLVAATFFPMAIALCRGADGSFGAPERSRRNLALLSACLGAIAVAAVPVLWALTQAAPDGYARQFGASGSMFSNAVFGLLPALVPFTPVSQPPGWAATVADVAWLVLLMAAFGRSPNDAERRHRRWLLGIALALPAARLLVYLPWPLQYPYYSIPFLTGVAVVSAIGGSRMSDAQGRSRAVVVAAGVLVILHAAAAADAQASRYFALRRVTDALVSELYALGQAGGLDSIAIAVPRAKEQAWWGLGPTLARFGDATGRPLPPISERTCEVARAVAAAPASRQAVVILRWQCASSGTPSKRLLDFTRRARFERLTFIVDTLQADIHVQAITP